MNWENVKILTDFILNNYPKAYAEIKGSPQYPDIKGGVFFYETEIDNGRKGTYIVTEITDLPYEEGDCAEQFLGYHIHEGRFCKGDREDIFKESEGHFNPKNCPHPAHAGDMPPLLNNHGTAVSIVLDSQFDLKDIVGRTIIVHSKADDFRTQPSGDSGEKIACGKIRWYHM